MRWVAVLVLVAACDDNGFRPIADIDAPSCVGRAANPGHVYGTVDLHDDGVTPFGDVNRATVSVLSSGEYEVMLSSDSLILFLHVGDNTSTLIGGNGDEYPGRAVIQYDCGVG